MRKSLETILISSIFEKESDENLTVSSFKSAINLILKGKDIFSLVPDAVFVSIDRFSKIEKLTGSKVGLAKDFTKIQNEEADFSVKYFNKEGVLIYDGLHASAFGRMSYIYRSKGIRIYVFKNLEIKIVAPFCTIDHDGFQLKQEEVASYKLSEIKTKKDVNEIMGYTRDDPNNPSENKIFIQKLISLITNIKRAFHRDFFLEYLLTPPDVDILSDFSKNLRYELWQTSLSKKFEATWGKELQNNCINLLSTLNISPSAGQIINFIRINSKDKNTKEILERLNRLETNFNDSINSLKNKKEPIIEFKPNFSGIGINGNEAYRRLKNLWDTKRNLPSDS